MLKKVVVNDLVYGGKCVNMKVRLNSAFLFFNVAVMRKYFYADGIGYASLAYDSDTKVLVVTPGKEGDSNTLKVGKTERDGKIRFGFLPIKRVAATYGFVELLDNETVPVEGVEGSFSIHLVHKKANK